MEITELDRPDDDGAMARLAELCGRVEELLGRVRGGGEVSPADLDAVRREAVRIGLEKDPALFRPFVACLRFDIN